MGMSKTTAESPGADGAATSGVGALLAGAGATVVMRTGSGTGATAVGDGACPLAVTMTTG